MAEMLFDVLLDDCVIARGMPLNYAMILVEGVFEKFPLDDAMVLKIQRSDKPWSA